MHELTSTLAPERSSGILFFFHAFTGCDTVSAFRGKGKTSAWQTWDVCPEASDVFTKLSCYPTDVEEDDTVISVALRRIAPPGFHFIEAARPIPPDARSDNVEFRNHGGLALVLRDSIKVHKRELNVNVSTFEYLCGYVTSADGHFMLLAIYRPGSQAVCDAFFDDLSAVLEQLAVYNCPVVVCGDFNIHVDRSDDKHAAQLLQLLQTFDMVQHVTEPTHVAGYTLDLVIARQDTTIDRVRVAAPISDHSLVIFTLRAKKPATAVQCVTS